MTTFELLVPGVPHGVRDRTTEQPIYKRAAHQLDGPRLFGGKIQRRNDAGDLTASDDLGVASESLAV
jgi:hypothetical protein